MAIADGAATLCLRFPYVNTLTPDVAVDAAELWSMTGWSDRGRST
jgi:hypothetical protein